MEPANWTQFAGQIAATLAAGMLANPAYSPKEMYPGQKLDSAVKLWADLQAKVLAEFSKDPSA